MHEIVPLLAGVLRPAMQVLAAPAVQRRLLTRDICEALALVEPVLQQRFGGPLIRRFEGCDKGAVASLRLDGTAFKVLEYLWDFSVSRFSIPQAIEDPYAPPLNGQKFDLLFTAESELGTSTEICRDLLKLVLGRSAIRCLVYRMPNRHAERQALEARFVRVLNNCAQFTDAPGIWLFVGLGWRQQPTECVITTLNDDNDGLVAVP